MFAFSFHFDSFMFLFVIMASIVASEIKMIKKTLFKSRIETADYKCHMKMKMCNMKTSFQKPPFSEVPKKR